MFRFETKPVLKSQENAVGNKFFYILMES